MGWWDEPNAVHAFNLSWISSVITAIAAVWGIASFMDTRSAILLCFGLENMVDFLSSIIVVWRFYSPSGTTNPEHEQFLSKREQRANVAISGIMTLLGFSVIVAAFEEIATEGNYNDEDDGTLLILSVSSAIIFGSLTGIKYRFAALLNSTSLEKDAFCSFIGTILSSSLFVNTLLIMQYHGLWWINPFVALICGFAALFIGIRALFDAMFVNGLPIYDLGWWVYSEGGPGINVSSGAGSGSGGGAATSGGGNNGGSPKVTTELPPLNEMDLDEEAPPPAVAAVDAAQEKDDTSIV